MTLEQPVKSIYIFLQDHYLIIIIRSIGSLFAKCKGGSLVMVR